MALLLAVRRVTKLSFFDKMCFQNRFFNCSNRVSTSKEFDIWQYPVIQQYYSAYEDLVGLTEVKSAQEKVLNVSICNFLQNLKLLLIISLSAQTKQAKS